MAVSAVVDSVVGLVAASVAVVVVALAASVAVVASAEVAVVPTGNSTTMHLDDLVAQLAQVHAATLVAVVLYGSSASDEHVIGHSDQNVLVIVESLSVETMRALSQTTRAWREAGNPPPLLLTRREWLGSADVFPMEYADILERHRVLRGSLPLEGVTVRAADLRLQLEQEALGKLLRLRRAVIAAGDDTARQREVLRASLSAFLVILRSVLRLHGEVPPRDADAVIARSAVHAGFAPAAFQTVLRFVRGGVLADGDVDATTRAYVAAAEGLAAHLDDARVG